MIRSSPSTLPDLFFEQAQKHPHRVYCYHEENGKWVSTLLKDQLDDVLKICSYLHQKIIKKGDAIAIMLPTSREWDIIEKALLFMGAIVVGIDPHAPFEQKKHMLSLSEARYLIANDRDPDLNVSQITLSDIKTALLTMPASKPDILISKADVCTIIFTSGTTSKPKGIAYTHEQFLMAANAILDVFKEVSKEDRMLSWLPLSNLFQRMLDALALSTATPIYFVSNPKEVMNKINEVNPTFFIGVPLFYERVRQGIFQKISQKSGSLKKLLDYSLKMAEKKNKTWIESCLLGFSKIVLLNPIKRVMGRSMRFMVSGSAPCPKSVLNFFWSLGIPLYEAYGLSENIVPMAIGSPSQYKMGSVGKIVELNSVKFFEDNEIGVKGPGVFKGYLKGEGAPSFREGYYLTGDTGYLDEEGFLFLTGRRSDWVKSSAGHRVSVLLIENTLKELPFIGQIAVIGSRKVPLAILHLNYPVEDGEISKTVKEKLHALPRHEQLGGILIIDRPFSIEEGELTANLKLKRSAIESRYQPFLDTIESNVHEGQFIIWRK